MCIKPGMLNSVVLYLSNEDLENVLAYCKERELPVSKFKSEKANLPNRVIVWGTKRQLKEFKEYY